MDRREEIHSLAFSSGPSTFFGTPYVSDLEKLPEGAKIAVLGVPFDEGVTNRPGTRFGPRGVREASSLYRHRPERGYYDIETGQKFLANVLMVDVGDVKVSPTQTDLTYENITSTVAALLDRGLFPVCVGGDHAVSFPIIRAFAPRGPINVVQLDTHMDFSDEIAGAHFGHGSPMRRASELENVCHISHLGIRRNAYEAYQESLAKGNLVITARGFQEMGPLKAVQSVPPGDCYITLDIDVYDPSIAPGTGTPELGGLYYNEVKTFLSSLASRPDVKVVGFDLVEVDPLYDVAGMTSQLAARVILDLLGVLFPNE